MNRWASCVSPTYDATSGESTIDITPVRHPDNQHQQTVILYLVNNPVVTGSNAPKSTHITLQNSPLIRVFRQ
jgi:hypothetical protein